MIIGIHHIAVCVPKLEDGLAFYRDALGFEQVERSDINGELPQVEATIGLKDPDARMAMLRCGNAHIELWEYLSPQPRDRTARPNDHGYTHLALQVRDIEAEHARLETVGVEFVGPPVDFGTISAIYGSDPFGNVLELYEIRDPERAQINNTPLARGELD